MTGLIARYGVLGVFLLMLPESACIPIPSEVTLLFSGYPVHRGWMSFPLGVLAVTAGNLAGSLVAYGDGASSILDGVPAARRILERWSNLLERRGDGAVSTARLIPLARWFITGRSTLGSAAAVRLA